MEGNTFKVTRCLHGDEPLLWQLYFDTTRLINSRDYTPAQCQRWAPVSKDMEEWSVRIRSGNPFVVRDECEILGFAELEDNGHIDYFYVHHKWQRKGVGRMLYAALEDEALRLKILLLYTESSITALPFFLSRGFVITRMEENIICDAPARRYLIRKLLPAAKPK